MFFELAHVLAHLKIESLVHDQKYCDVSKDEHHGKEETVWWI